MIKGMAKKGGPSKRKDAITRSLLHDLVLCLKKFQSNFMSTLLKAVFLLAYHGCFRIGELCKSKDLSHTIKLDNVLFINSPVTHLEITLNSFKHSKSPSTFSIPPSPDSDFCPIRALLHYLKIRPPGLGPLFLTETGSPLNRVTVSKILKSSLANLGLQPDSFDTHSFRVGRATDLALSGASDSLIREAGRWSSNAFQKYLRFDAFVVPQ